MKLVKRLDKLSPRIVVRNCTIVFALCVILAYALYPHWVTLSQFVTQWYTLCLFIVAIGAAVFEIWYVGDRLYRHDHFRAGAKFLYASAICNGLVLCVPYGGGQVRKDAHLAVTLFFVLFAAAGFSYVAKRLHHRLLGYLSGTLYILCTLELIFLARYKHHPVRPWTWTVLELMGVAALAAALYTIAVVLEKTANTTEQ